MSYTVAQFVLTEMAQVMTKMHSDGVPARCTAMMGAMVTMRWAAEELSLHDDRDIIRAVQLHMGALCAGSDGVGCPGGRLVTTALARFDVPALLSCVKAGLMLWRDPTLREVEESSKELASFRHWWRTGTRYEL